MEGTRKAVKMENGLGKMGLKTFQIRWQNTFANKNVKMLTTKILIHEIL